MSSLLRLLLLRTESVVKGWSLKIQFTGMDGILMKSSISIAASLFLIMPTISIR